jgi:hypothetical protein
MSIPSNARAARNGEVPALLTGASALSEEDVHPAVSSTSGPKATYFRDGSGSRPDMLRENTGSDLDEGHKVTEKRDLEKQHRYIANPTHDDLWITDDVNFLDVIMCHAWLKVWQIDPKNGCFECRMKCHWEFRLLNNQARTEPRVRVPGIRMPGVACKVDESRVWRDISEDTQHTMFFRGSSVFSFTGFEVFEIQDFPFDRQVLNLELFDFVWRRDKDSDTYEESMKIVHFTLETQSMLPQWKPLHCLIIPLNEQRNDLIECNSPKRLRPCCTHHIRDGHKIPVDIESSTGPLVRPNYCTRFNVKLRLERKHTYYIVQVFMVTYLITVASLLPMALDCNVDLIGDKLSLHAGGLLTLTAFKFGIAENLPSVPYSTFTDLYLMLQVVTLVAASVFGLVIYRVEEAGWISLRASNITSVIALCGSTLVWTGFFVYAAFFKERKEWIKVLDDQDYLNEEKESPNHALKDCGTDDGLLREP